MRESAHPHSSPEKRCILSLNMIEYISTVSWLATIIYSSVYVHVNVSYIIIILPDNCLQCEENKIKRRAVLWEIGC